ncbi:MAG: VOC family protein [Hyphomicrobiaceae bacterium]|nr:VOC family protein [Hyphomicrobiaceae bacterium]
MSTDTSPSPARALGFNHIALEVGDIDEALEFYGKIFDVKLRGRGGHMAFIDFGDQFLAIAATGKTEQDSERHFGLVVDDQAKALAAAQAAGAKFLSEGGNTFWDPWGNMFQIVQYSEIQFLKAEPVLDAMGMSDVGKSATALEELRQKGIDLS